MHLVCAYHGGSTNGNRKGRYKKSEESYGTHLCSRVMTSEEHTLGAKGVQLIYLDWIKLLTSFWAKVPESKKPQRHSCLVEPCNWCVIPIRG